METLKKAVENRNAPFEVGGKAGTKGRIVSLRVSERMEQLLEEQAQEWNMSISDTLRSVLNFYFLPPLLMEAWEKKVEDLVEVDTKARGVNSEDLNAPTQAQRIEEVLVDSEEAEEYALFINGLWEKNVKYWETLREEAIAMHEIASKQLFETAEALKRIAEKLPQFEEVEQP